MYVNVHPVTTVRVGGMVAEIDELLAPVIDATWRNGIQTLTSCQDAGESNVSWVSKLPHMADYVATWKGWAFIDFAVEQGLAFLDAVAGAGVRDAFYVRIVHWAAPDAWQVNVRPYDAAMFDEVVPSRFGLRLMQVMFPQYDIAEIGRRLNDHAAGRVVPPASTDWSSVGR
ncbi:hypothetical protein Ais01nite_08140 [Asanoa ishikariensis]|uniref:Uncharacterized protein n=1 Tax=Asanoa ishikariensis TaxID=137265 RepID=A0A1H3TBG2_9ACTN|nr:hypothetical protein [Asanoa ishikariensis]GIF62779.1 hypothetical protein Ais01nite_08140 [Asanoa ishikariensis]SDZ47198.1 hypothetical protein SAMN05421684_5420 [Asanoa ishikariensis]